MNIYVGNLSWTMTDDQLNALFAPYGTITSAKILKDKVSGRSKGFGFVEMENADEANKAIAELNETDQGGRKIVVNESKPRQEGSGGGGYKKSYGGGGGGSRGGYNKDY
jgi:RNA recognition motif-containing protein